jgi:hypothetical protein
LRNQAGIGSNHALDGVKSFSDACRANRYQQPHAEQGLYAAPDKRATNQ